MLPSIPRSFRSHSRSCLFVRGRGGSAAIAYAALAVGNGSSRLACRLSCGHRLLRPSVLLLNPTCANQALSPRPTQQKHARTHDWFCPILQMASNLQSYVYMSENGLLVAESDNAQNKFLPSRAPVMNCIADFHSPLHVRHEVAALRHFSPAMRGCCYR